MRLANSFSAPTRASPLGSFSVLACFCAFLSWPWRVFMQDYQTSDCSAVMHTSFYPFNICLYPSGGPRHSVDTV